MPKESSSAQNEKLMGALAYLAGPVTGIIFLLMEKNNSFIRFHAMQSIVVLGGLWILSIVLGFIPVINILSFMVMPIVMLITWIVLMYKAFSGEKFKFPYFGDIAEKQLAKMGK